MYCVKKMGKGVVFGALDSGGGWYGPRWVGGRWERAREAKIGSWSVDIGGDTW